MRGKQRMARRGAHQRCAGPVGQNSQAQFGRTQLSGNINQISRPCARPQDSLARRQDPQHSDLHRNRGIPRGVSADQPYFECLRGPSHSNEKAAEPFASVCFGQCQCQQEAVRPRSHGRQIAHRAGQSLVADGFGGMQLWKKMDSFQERIRARGQFAFVPEFYERGIVADASADLGRCRWERETGEAADDPAENYFFVEFGHLCFFAARDRPGGRIIRVGYPARGSDVQRWDVGFQVSLAKMRRLLVPLSGIPSVGAGML